MEQENHVNIIDRFMEQENHVNIIDIRRHQFDYLFSGRSRMNIFQILNNNVLPKTLFEDFFIC